MSTGGSFYPPRSGGPGTPGNGSVPSDVRSIRALAGGNTHFSFEPPFEVEPVVTATYEGDQPGLIELRITTLDLNHVNVQAQYSLHAAPPLPVTQGFVHILAATPSTGPE